MKKLTRLIALLLTVLMVSTSLVSCDVIQSVVGNIPGIGEQNPGTDDPTPTPTPHTCESKCEECGKCEDKTCSMTACKDKCQGHVAPHTCESKCEDCGKCLDTKCTESACVDKCQGHVPPHECESVCPDCGKCFDEDCSEDACVEKCEGHESGPVNASAYGYMPIITEQMPAIYINTEDGSNEWVQKYNRQDKINGLIDYVDATISTGNCDDEYKFSDYAAEVKVRGNYTLEYVKKPIRIKFKKSAKTNLFGLNDGEEYRNWVLLADWKDLSMCNNTVAFYLGNTILGSDGYYCTDFRNVEVYLNGEYWGVYLLVEQQEVKDGRSSVPEVDDDYTGNDIGYLFEYDGYYSVEGQSYLQGGDGDPTFTITYPSGTVYRSNIGYTVKSDLYADSQLSFLKNYLQNAYYIAFQATKGNYYKFDENYNVVADTSATSAKAVISKVIDIQSLVDIYILNEIACDLDVDWSSFYMSLNMTAEGNKKVTFEAPWDWDSCFGLRNGVVNNAQGMYASEKGNPWLNLLKGQDWYQEMIREKWAEMKEYNLLENTINLVKTEKETYEQYYIANYTRWPSRVQNGNSECNSTLQSFRDINTAQGNAADFLVDWLTKRFAYLDSQWTIIEVDENLPENAEVYKYEAEYATLGGGGAVREGEDKSYASNNSYIGQVRLGVTITFTVTAEEATTAYLFAGVSKRAGDRDFNDLFSVTVNGKTVLIPARTIPGISGSEEEWHTFVSVKLAPVELVAGENTIVFTTISSSATNFDYIEIYSAEELE